MLISTETSRCAFITCNLLSPIKLSLSISVIGRTLVIPDAAVTLLTFFLPRYPAAAKAEVKEEVTTVSGKVDGEKAEKKSNFIHFSVIRFYLLPFR